MKKLPRFLLVITTLGLASLASAQTDGPRRGPGGRGPGGPGGRGPGHPIVRAIDADHDGVLSPAELANAPAALRSLDANGDGTVSVDELRPPRPANAPTRRAEAPIRLVGEPRESADHPRPVDPVMLALDANADGALSAGEITNATTSLNALDANKDGQLTPDEYRPLPPTA